MNGKGKELKKTSFIKKSKLSKSRLFFKSLIKKPLTAKTAVKSATPTPISKTTKSNALDLQDIFADLKNLSKISISKNVCDNCCFLIICAKHNRIMLRKNYTFFPYISLNSMKTWYESALQGACLLINDKLTKKDETIFQKFFCMHILRFQLPQTQRFITRLIYLAELNNSNTNDSSNNNSNLINCCQDSNHYKWFPINDAIQSKIDKIWGPEVSYFTNLFETSSSDPSVSSSSDSNSIAITVVEYSLNDAFKYIPRDRPLSMEDNLLIKTNISVNDIERLYADFIEHCFPSFFLTRFSFKIFLLKHQIETNLKIINRYFSAFRFRQKQYMQFHELLLGLAAIDPNAPNEEFRFKLIFRYYDYDKDNLLNLQEFRRLLLDLQKLSIITSTPINMTTGNISTEQIKNLIKKIISTTTTTTTTTSLYSNANEESLTFENFKQAIQNGLIRGTTLLCRSTLSPYAQITRSLATMKLCTPVSNKKLKNILLNSPYEGICKNCKLTKNNYFISQNLILLDFKGFQKELLPLNGERFNFNNSKKLFSNFNTDDHSKNIQKNSELIFYILKEIHKFNKIKDKDLQNFQKISKFGLFSSLNRTELQAFADDFKSLCLEIAKLVEKEQRILKLDDPIYVIGDIHGNLEDLLTLELCLWKNFPLLTANYLFLGDYVDRGKWSFECFLYLILLKYLQPNRIFLLRGNHELRPIQRKYSFYKELIKKYGQLYGELFFDFINEIFDRLPFGAIIGSSIYCAHGGLPFSEKNLQKINEKTSHIVRDAELEAIHLWEILWSDPLEFSKFNETAKILGISPNCLSGLFLPNVKRGTSYFYNEYAVIEFFKENNLNFMIRAHEVPAMGFKFNFGTLCTTIFSCSHYCGADNECAVVFIDRQSRIRLIRIDTSRNLPAT